MNRHRIVSAIVLTLTLLLGVFLGSAFAAQPSMQAALSHLRNAERALDRATSDKGGHRARALALVRDAINEVEKGIAYDRRN